MHSSNPENYQTLAPPSKQAPNEPATGVPLGPSSCLYYELGALLCVSLLHRICCYRSKMRNQYMLPEDPCPDCLVHCCCDLCAICQEYRELQHRGFDMSVGWEENMARQNHGVVMPPMAPGRMSR
ncbi:hypothetical protein LguiB_025240 [Lonicera macranthoides]